MYFKNIAGEAYLMNNQIAVLNTDEGRYTFESRDPDLVQARYRDSVSILKLILIETDNSKKDLNQNG